MSYVQCSASKDVVRAAAQQAAKRLRDTSRPYCESLIEFDAINDVRWQILFVFTDKDGQNPVVMFF